MAEIAARAGIHRCYELELGGELNLPRGARHADAAGFERLPQHFQHVAIELGRFVEKEDAMHGHGDFTRPGIAATADECDTGRCVMRRAKGPALPVAHTKPAVPSDCTAADSRACSCVIDGKIPGNALRASFYRRRAAQP